MTKHFGRLFLASAMVAACASTHAATIAEAKRLPDKSSVYFSQKVVTYTSPDMFYIGEPSGPSGIRCLRPGNTFAVGALATLSGTIFTDANGERYVTNC